jgi:hypothetical protein
LIYSLLGKHNVKVDGRENLIGVIAGELNRPTQWLSTQEKLAVYLVGREFDNPEGKSGWRAQVGGDAVVTTSTHYRNLTAEELAAGIKVTNSHTSKLYLELAVSGSAARMPTAPDTGFELTRTLHAADGSTIGNRALQVGEAVVVQLHVKTRGRIANGMVIDRIPAGLEIENLNIVQGEGMPAFRIGNIDVAEVMRNTNIQHVEFRDDRFVAAVKLDREVRLFYRARVVTPGKFVVPPLYVEDMYRPQLFGIAGGGETLTVVDTPAPK